MLTFDAGARVSPSTPVEKPGAAVSTSSTLAAPAALRAPEAPASFRCEGVDTERLAAHGHPGVAACGCGIQASLVTAKKLPVAWAPQRPITYDVRIDNPSSGYVEVTAHIPTAGKKTLDLAMPRWTPGSYAIRDFAKNIDDDMRAFAADGAPVALEKTGVSSWRVDTAGGDVVTVRYRVYAHAELSVRTNWTEPAFALLNGAATYITLANDDYERPHEVRIDAPSYRGGPVSALENPNGEPARFIAPTFDKLIDSPIALGITDRRELVVDGVVYVLATSGADKIWDAAKAEGDLRRVIEQMHKVWGKPPFSRYVFLNLLSGARGGLEHLDSTVLMDTAWGTRTREAYASWLTLAAHELFHAWNVKRLRPVELGPFDYSRENITKMLWVAEGFTAYYDKLLVRRSGIYTPAEYLRRLSEIIATVQGAPGHTVQTLCGSSRDSWIKYYQPTENSKNVEISYYDKGSLVGFLLDAQIRKRTDGKKTLDDVMRTAYARYSGDKGYTPEEFEAVISEVAGTDMKPWLDDAVRSTKDLPLAEGLAIMGLRFKEAPAPSEGAYLGADTSIDNHRMIASRVVADSPAARAGLMPGDEILAIGDYRVAPGQLEERLKRYQPGEATTLLVSRRGHLETLKVTFATPPRKQWDIEIDPEAAADAVARRKDWLGA